ncbi:MAG: efflux RND transporter periplasmic adaptor subunit [Thermodesulfovibrionales bacterium]
MQISAIGTVEPSSTVAVRAQVGGTLTRVHFAEGKDVRRGDLLFTIDPRPHEAALRQAEAALARSAAQLENARAEERRYEELVRKGYVAQTQYEQVRTNAQALEATVQADRAVVENAKLNLGYCFIRSPLDGRTGSLMVHEGNLIKANADSPMVTIHQVQPVHAGFSVPEKNLPEIKKYMTAGSLRVEAFAAKDDPEPAVGRLTFIENAVDPATGTIKLKASFENRGRKLWPGQFVNVVITLSMLRDATVVPTAAVQTGQQGQFVFVVKQDQTAEVRPVTIGPLYQDLAVVEKGLQPGERVVTDGQMRLMPGATVEIKQPQAPGSAPVPSAEPGKKTAPSAPQETAK